LKKAFQNPFRAQFLAVFQAVKDDSANGILSDAHLDRCEESTSKLTIPITPTRLSKKGDGQSIMKVKVNRQLSSGNYHINFEVGDFTPDELAKMDSFGVPHITLQWKAQGGSTVTSAVALNRINKVYNAVFNTEVAAKSYEEAILAQIRKAMQRLRESQDKFSSSEEVSL
jgi:hypothetical protein